MKKMLFKVVALVMVLMFFSVQTAMAIDWVTANQATIQWDAVTADSDGDPLPAGTHVAYKVGYTSQTTPDKANLTVVETTTLLESTITFAVKGKYIVGVQALHIEDGTGEQLAESVFAWSDVPADCTDTDGDGTGNDFGIRFFAALPSTKIGPKPVVP
jgi:hypothetical protein